ncbi:tol-pal system YbgF family protein [Collimonas sp. NPDC087041]|uniref:tetratricopeptide repeat protein n=1 Tax=Collimonas sp. NPDC087041 TaxID=3363960 RepID=UPI003824B667
MSDTATEKPYRNITPFWQRLPQFFLYPAQPQLLWHPAVYALIGAGLWMLGGYGEDGGFSPLILIITVLVGIGFLVDLMRQAFRVLEQTSLGNLRHADFDEPNDVHKMSPYKLLLVVLVQGFFIAILGEIHPLLLLAGNAVANLMLPACIMVLGHTHSFTEAINPFNVFKMIKAVGWPYLALWVFGFILNQSAPVLIALFVGKLPIVLLVGLGIFAFAYFTLVGFNLMGYTMYQYHQEIGYSPDRNFEINALASSRKNRPLTDEEILAQQIGAMIRDGNIDMAMEMVWEELRYDQHNAQLCGHYAKLLMLKGDTKKQLEHAQRHLFALARSGKAGRIGDTWRQARQLDPEFKVDNPDHVLDIATAAASIREYQVALEIVSGFHKRAARHKDVPAVLVLAGKLLSDHLRQDARAMALFNHVIAQWPTSPAAVEAQQYKQIIERLAEPSSPA